ncbi:immune inhibitor A [Paracrocinitomix mangrovi]|uniref:M14 family zinc carboxypeptidase n=1 Tax=Paracrocinitomix mangrovi TaxID=2862509 RepID=UPI001C8DFE27|nr:M14 family zinc carboxypeptidase [Paracrocinitomix mangrovi]UKN00935.1 immune inhibitor A [Paracrocinitomix mangrovi]
MKKISLLLLMLLAIAPVFSQLKWSRVKVFGTNEELRKLGDLGLPVDHGELKQNTWFMTDFSELEIAELDAHNFVYEIVIDDVKAYYQSDRSEIATKGADRAACPSSTGGSSYNPTTPSNFNLGTMAGFYKYQEFIDELDDMRTQYPNLISAKSPIGSYTTVDGNSIYWVRISDNPDTDEAEEEVLYSALHHAREPASLSQLIYYMWYMLENYGTDPEVTYLIDNTEMYFVPMLNPDGYKYNELNSPNGGGMHRKNRNLVSGGSSNQGVDLNRNYGYHWNTTGVSANPGFDTWPGTGSFSEIETQAMKWFVEQREFKFAFNAHTHGNQLLYPIGWSDNEFAPHHNYFDAFTTHMVKFNGYENIKSSGLYPASGDSDDWMYTDDIGVNHDTIFAMTPECSSEGTNNDFWPPQSSIEAICKANVHMNMTLAHMPHVFGVTTPLGTSKVQDPNGYFSYNLERLGLTDGPITISMTAITGITSFGSSNVHNLNLMEIVEDSIQYTLDAGLNFGDDIIYVLETDNGTWTRKDTIYKTFGAGTALFTDDCSDLSNWTGSWSTTTEDFVSPSTCITDSPNNDYSNNQDKNITLNQSFDFGNATYAYITFNAKWQIEDNWDYVEFLASTNGGSTWTPLCGLYTNQGGSNQDVDEPLYDGFQTSWVLEEIDLTDYIGQTNVKFRFYLNTDQGVVEDGYYFDDFTVYTDATSDMGNHELTLDDISIYPNPANNNVFVKFDAGLNIQNVQITNSIGQLIVKEKVNSNYVEINTTDFAEGIYFVTVIDDQNRSITKRLSIIK